MEKVFWFFICEKEEEKILLLKSIYSQKKYEIRVGKISSLKAL